MTNIKRYVHDYGGDGEVIVLLHGFLASSSYWKRLRPRLSTEGYRVITIDLLGFGNAPKPKHISYTYAEHMAHINNAVASLSLNKQFILAGHSMGALLAMRFALTYPQNIASLILLHPPLYSSTDQAHKILRSTGAHYRFLLYSRFRRLGWILIKIFIRSISNHSRHAREGSLKHVIEPAEAFYDLDKLKAKTLLVVGTSDRSVYVQNIQDKLFSDNITLAVEKLSHHSPLLKPDYIKDLVLKFVKSTTG